MGRGEFRKAVFVVAYARTPKGIEYVLLKRKLHWKGWEFPKGKVEFLERKKKAALREVKEETGLKVLKSTLKNHHIKGKYFYKKALEDRPGQIGQTYQLFSVEVVKGKVKVDRKEHVEGKFFNYKDALKKLTWSNQRKCLRVVDSYLSS